MDEKARGFADDQLPSAHPVAVRRGHAQRGDRQLRPDQLRQGRCGAPAAGRLRRRAEVLRRAPRLPDPARLWQRPAGRPDRCRGGQLGQGPGRLVQGLAARPPGPARCAASSAPMPAARSPSSPSCRRGAPSCARTGSRSGSTSGPAARWRAPAAGCRCRRVPGRRCRSWRGVAQPDLILLNDDDTGYVLVRFDPRSLRTVLESAGELPDAAARAVCWNAVIDMVRQGELPVSGVRGHAGPRHGGGTLTAGAAGAARARRAAHHPAGRTRARRGKPSCGSPTLPRSCWARPSRAATISWPGSSCSPGRRPPTDQLDLIAALLAGSTAIPGLLVDAELRWSLLQRMAATGRADDAGIDAQLAGRPQRRRPPQRRRVPGRDSRRRSQGSGLAAAHRRPPRPGKR